jgi:hypothetical protein
VWHREATSDSIHLGPYILVGGYGENWCSYERKVKIGEVRMIDGILHYAQAIDPQFLSKPKVSWARVDGSRGRLGKEKFKPKAVNSDKHNSVTGNAG